MRKSLKDLWNKINKPRNEADKIVNNLFKFLGKREVLEEVKNVWNEVTYSVENVRYSNSPSPQWKLLLTGIELPEYGSGVFYPFLRYLGIEKDSPEPCAIRTEEGFTNIPIFNVDNLPEGNRLARKIIEGYVRNKGVIERGLAEIDRVRPKSFEEEYRLREKLKEILDFKS